MIIPPIGATSVLGSDASIPSIGGLGGGAQIGSPTSSSASGGSFADALTNAVNSVQQTQNTADSASQALATGQVSDPTQAITAVENAQLAMELASQVSTKLISDVQTIFSTQV